VCVVCVCVCVCVVCVCVVCVWLVWHLCVCVMCVVCVCVCVCGVCSVCVCVLRRNCLFTDYGIHAGTSHHTQFQMVSANIDRF